jgi:hypothetical protein
MQYQEIYRVHHTRDCGAIYQLFEKDGKNFVQCPLTDVGMEIVKCLCCCLPHLGQVISQRPPYRGHQAIRIHRHLHRWKQFI